MNPLIIAGALVAGLAVPAGLAGVTTTALAAGTASPQATCPADDPDCVPDAHADATPVSIPAATSARVAAAIRTSMSLVGQRSGWYHKCDKLACRAYGYYNSGYATANVHWYQMVASGHAHPGNRCPPAGAFVFWATGGSAGHIALVVANDGTCNPAGIKVVTNDWGDRAAGAFGGVYQTTLAGIENGWMSRGGYRGWSDPVCAGAMLG